MHGTSKDVAAPSHASYIGFMFHVVPEDKISLTLEDPERPPDSNKYK